MRRTVCTYCTLRAGAHEREWITVQQGTAQVRLCSMYCLADWAAEQDQARTAAKATARATAQPVAG